MFVCRPQVSAYWSDLCPQIYDALATILHKEVFWGKLTVGYFCRLPGDSRGVPFPRDRWSSLIAAEGGPSNGHYEHQTRPCTKDLCSD